MEDRVVLSSGSLASPGRVASINAEIFRAKKAPTLLILDSANGLSGATSTFVATLSSNGSPLVGNTVTFRVRGRIVGKARTDANGVATLSNVPLKGLGAGIYPRAIAASFAGNALQKPRSVRGSLTVSVFATTLSWVSASGLYGGSVQYTATLTSNGAPVSGELISFSYNGQSVGDATTNRSGVATLTTFSPSDVNRGAYGNAVTASFAGDVNFQQNAASGTLTLNQGQAFVSLGGLYQTYTGLPTSVTVSTFPVGLPYTLSYTNGSGAPVTNPTVAGSYTAVASITSPNYAGSASETLVIAPAPITINGIVATGKVYDGSTSATIDTIGAAISGAAAGDDVALNASGAVGVFDTKNAGTSKTVTVYGLSLTGADAGNYVLTPPTTTADISAATLTVTGITANDKGYDGTTTATLDTSDAALVGVVPGDVVTLDTNSATGTFDSPDVGTGKTVTIGGLTLSGADAGNYSLVQPTTTADINKGTLTVTGITASNKVYDGTTDATLDTTGITLDGVVPGDDVTLDDSAVVGSFDTKDAGTSKTVTITGLTLGGADADKYTLVQPTTTADISPATLTVTGITAGDKVYDGTTNATLDTSGAMLSGVIAGDDVTLDASGATGTFDTKDVGTVKTVTVSGLSLTGADAGNYVITPPTTTADISAAALTVTGITASDKVYDSTTDATLDTTAAALVGVVAGDDVALDAGGAIGTFDTKDVGAGKTVSVVGVLLTGTDAGNYVLTQPTTTADISAATLTVTGITTSNKVYDGTTDASPDTTGAMLVGAVAGDDVQLNGSGATGTFDTRDVGTGKTVSVSGLLLSGTDAGNYILTQPTTTADISAATITVTGITASDKVYDGTTDASLDTTGAMLVGAVVGDDVALDATGAAGTFDTKDAGTGKTVTVSGLLLTGADAGNYVLAPPTTTADISAASLTVTGVTASNKVYNGTTDASFDTTGATLVGVVAGDDVVLGSPPAATASFDTKDVGTGKTVTVNGLVLTGADAGDYVLTSPTTTADISAATLTVTGITATDKVYDGNTNATLDTTGATLVGFVVGDDVTLDVSGAIGTFDSPDVGTDKTVSITGLTISGADAGNYTLTQPTTTASIIAM